MVRRNKATAYVVATDFAITEGPYYAPTGLVFGKWGEETAYRSGTPARFFFDEKKRQVTGKFEDATLYETHEAAEQAAFLLVCLDPTLADHVQPMLMKEARREIARQRQADRDRYKGSGLDGAGMRDYGSLVLPAHLKGKVEEPKWPDEVEDDAK